jgi:subtilisin family serine protease
MFKRMTASAKSPDVDDPLALVDLPRLMAINRGRRAMRVGLIDGPVRSTHPDFAGARLEFLYATQDVSRPAHGDAACLHATSVAGILVARPGSGAPAICPDVTLLVCPLFFDATSRRTAAPDELASAIVRTIEAGARIVNLSLELAPRTSTGHGRLQDALEYAAYRGLIIIAAAGNRGTIDSSVITRHRSVIPVVAYDLQGRPTRFSNLGHSIGRRGVGAPGMGIVSLAASGGLRPFGGTSAATAVVSGAMALLWSAFPEADATDLIIAVTRPTSRRVSILPPLLHAWEAYKMLHRTAGRGSKIGDGRQKASG